MRVIKIIVIAHGCREAEGFGVPVINIVRFRLETKVRRRIVVPNSRGRCSWGARRNFWRTTRWRAKFTWARNSICRILRRTTGNQRTFHLPGKAKIPGVQNTPGTLKRIYYTLRRRICLTAINPPMASNAAMEGSGTGIGSSKRLVEVRSNSMPVGAPLKSLALNPASLPNVISV